MMSCGDWDAHLGLRRGRGATSTKPGHLRKPSLVARIWRQNGEKQQAFSAHEKQMLLESISIDERYILLVSILQNTVNPHEKQNQIKH